MFEEREATGANVNFTVICCFLASSVILSPCPQVPPFLFLLFPTHDSMKHRNTALHNYFLQKRCDWRELL